MALFTDLKLFALGAATVIDTALLLMLLDRNNRRRLIVPLLVVIAGTWLYHVGALGQALLNDSRLPLAIAFSRALLVAVALGLLLMPSAMLHGVLRASLTGVDYTLAKDWRYALLYLPLLALAPLGVELLTAADPTARFSALTVDWGAAYMVWLLSVNLAAGVGFLGLRQALSRGWTRQFVQTAGWGLLALVLAQGVLFFVVLRAWPQYAEVWQLLLTLSPLPLVLLVGYFVVRFNFLQLVLERVLIYGTLIAAAALFHQVFLLDLWRSLSERYRVNFALVEGIALFALILAVRPLRERSAEALRYLLGRRIDAVRVSTRRLARALAGQSGAERGAILDWFVDQGPPALEVDALAVWLFDAGGRVTACANSGIHIDDADVTALHGALRARGVHLCRPSSAPGVALGDLLLNAGAAAAVALDHPQVDGLMLVGRGGGDMYQERLNALSMVAEQLAITLDASRVQAERRLAERQALQNDKLAALGLVAGSIAHEVKNPLSAIKTVATVMHEELPADSPHREDVEMIAAEVGRLATTVDRLLQFARPAQPGQRPTTLQDAADTVLQVMRHLARQRGVTLTASLAGLPAVDADPASLREILFNLIGNAVEAVGGNGRVELTGREAGNRIELRVNDNGPGVPAELRARLFEPFASGKPDGTGLGLYLVKLRVDELGGEIDYRSDAEGSTFILRLPVYSPS